MKLNSLSQFQTQPKEYNLLPSGRETLQPKQPRNAFVFSERDMPGYKKKFTGPNNVEGGTHHSRSYLHEKNKRDVKRKEGRKRFEPYVRRPVPKLTALAGVVTRELECVPVENEEYLKLERQKAETMLKPKEVAQISFENLKDARYLAPGTVTAYGKTVSAKVSQLISSRIYPHSQLQQQEQKKRAAAKENRAARRPKNEVIDLILELFQYYQYWGLRELRQKTKQPDAYLREVLNEIATMWRSGDMNGKWELKPEFKERSQFAKGAEGMAPDVPDSDEDDDENETFEDV
jgi:transcription initiation factor TFIIF subunit beta